jgi:hypothetical protein
MVALSAPHLLAGSAPGELDPALYPRRLGELKAMMQVLAPEKNASVENMYIQRLKQFRYVCGVPFEDIQWDSKLYALAQHAASICAKLGKLTHTPERPAGMSDEEYELGKTGAGKSNLYQGKVHPIGCVDGWMDDSDQHNIDRVGHRRWCINPTMVKTAFGSEGGFAAMHAHDTSRSNVPDWDFVCYPARGYMPIELFGNKHAWSVSPNMNKYATPNKDSIQVSIKPANAKLEPEGAALSLNYFNVENSGFGSGTAIIFRPETMAIAGEGKYIVEINGLKTKKGEAAPIRYLVHFVNVQKAADTADGKLIYTAYYEKRLKAAQAQPTKVDQLDALTALLEEKFLAGADPSVGMAANSALKELLKDPAVRKEQETAQRYKSVAEYERKAGKNKNQLVQAALGYRDLSAAYKETRAGQKAADDFERLKKTVQ